MHHSKTVRVIALIALIVMPTTFAGHDHPAVAATHSSAGAVTITWWNPDIVSWQPTYQAIATAFMHANPSIKVQVVNIPETGYDTKVTTNIAGGRGPDVWVLDPAHRLNSSPLAGPAAQPIHDRGPFQPQHLVPAGGRNALTYKGRTMRCRVTSASAPWPTTHLVQCRACAAADQPLDARDMVNAAQKLTNAGKRQWGLNYEGNFGVITDLSPILWDFGGSFVSDDGHKAVGYMDSPGTIRAVQFVYDLINTWKIVPPAAMMSAFGVAGSSSSGNAFLAGNAAMDPIDGDYALANLNSSSFKWGEAPYPTVAGQPHYAYVYPASYAMWRGSAHKTQAWQLLKFISVAGSQRYRCQITGLDAADAATWQQFGLDKNPAWAAFWQARTFRRNCRRGRSPSSGMTAPGRSTTWPARSSETPFRGRHPCPAQDHCRQRAELFRPRLSACITFSLRCRAGACPSRPRRSLTLTPSRGRAPPPACPNARAGRRPRQRR